MTVDIKTLQATDRKAWEALARGYKRFYETDIPDSEYAAAWQRLLHDPRFVGLAAWRGGAIVGIVHALFHASTWADEVCYLQDLFVAEAARGFGAGAALIDAVAAASRRRGAGRLYWLTHHSNSRARVLYERMAVNKGFIRYDMAL